MPDGILYTLITDEIVCDMEDYDDDYDIPFDDMSEEDFLYRAMNEEDPMYMGPDDCECSDCPYEDYEDCEDFEDFEDRNANYIEPEDDFRINLLPGCSASNYRGWPPKIRRGYAQPSMSPYPSAEEDDLDTWKKALKFVGYTFLIGGAIIFVLWLVM